MKNAIIEGRLDLIRDTLGMLTEATLLIRRSVAIQAELDTDEAELHAESAAAMGGTAEPARGGTNEPI